MSISGNMTREERADLRNTIESKKKIIEDRCNRNVVTLRNASSKGVSELECQRIQAISAAYKTLKKDEVKCARSIKQEETASKSKLKELRKEFREINVPELTDYKKAATAVKIRISEVEDEVRLNISRHRKVYRDKVKYKLAKINYKYDNEINDLEQQFIRKIATIQMWTDDEVTGLDLEIQFANLRDFIFEQNNIAGEHGVTYAGIVKKLKERGYRISNNINLLQPSPDARSARKKELEEAIIIEEDDEEDDFMTGLEDEGILLQVAGEPVLSDRVSLHEPSDGDLQDVISLEDEILSDNE